MSLPAFTLDLPTRIRFGRGTAQEAPGAIAAHGQRVLLVHGRDAGRVAWLRTALAERGCTVTLIACPSEPDLALLETARASGLEGDPQVVVGCGGGAALDLAKALAALIPAPGASLDHLEVVGRGLPLVAPPLPLIALPTTAGTGSEATKNAVIGVPEHGRKVSLRDPAMLPRLALIDPALTDGTPKAVTLASGLDALTQVIEPYLSTRANPVTDALCASAIPRGLRGLKRLMQTEDPDARDALAYTSHLSGIALANAGLGAVHGLAGVIGGVVPGAAHGAICGRLLVPVLAANRAGLSPDSPALRRFEQIEVWITEVFGPGGSADLADWAQSHGLPGLQALGVNAAQHASIAQAAQVSSSMKANPVPLDAAILERLLDAAA